VDHHVQEEEDHENQVEEKVQDLLTSFPVQEHQDQVEAQVFLAFQVA
jgi:hypothetical protein